MSQISTTTYYLSTAEAAERCGLTVPGFLKRGTPSPDAVIGNRRGWTPETIDAWNAQWSPRPSSRDDEALRTDGEAPEDD